MKLLQLVDQDKMLVIKATAALMLNSYPKQQGLEPGEISVFVPRVKGTRPAKNPAKTTRSTPGVFVVGGIINGILPSI